MRPAASQYLPDSPFAHYHLRAASVTDASALTALLQQLAPDEPRADAKLMALRLSELPVSRVVRCRSTRKVNHIIGCSGNCYSIYCI